MRTFIFITALIICTISNVGAKTNKRIIKPYGFLKLDMAYDQARTNNGNYVFWVNPYNKNEKIVNLI